MVLILSVSPDPVFGRATYVRSDVADASPVSSSSFCDAVRVGGYKIMRKGPQGFGARPKSLLFLNQVKTTL